MLSLSHTLRLLPALLLGLFALSANAQSFRVQCPTSTTLHLSDPADPAANPIGGRIKCQQLSGGDGFATMGDGTQTYLFGFGPLSGLADLAKGLPGTQSASVFINDNSLNLDSIFIGAPVDQTDPTNESPNLEDITWSATPILSQRILVTPLLVTHTFGCRIARTSTGLPADKMSYGTWQAATGTAPASANFALRARLINFDTRNNVPDATGWLYYALGNSDGTGTGDATATIA